MFLNFKRYFWLIGVNKKYILIDVGNMKMEDLLVKKIVEMFENVL